jgi:glycosyltransferase involved in cell wall biosynthesis
MFHRPVIASNVGGMAERIRHDVDGLLFHVADARSLARTMRRACSEEALWERLVAGIEQPPARRVMVDRFLDVYRARELVGAD